MKYQGLTDKEVIENRKKYGSNSIEYKKNNSFIRLFLESLGDPIIKILLIAFCIKMLFAFKEFNIYETIGILLSIITACLVSSISEYGSEKAFKRLESDASKIMVKVKRNNKTLEIPIDDIVVNDIVILYSGDRIPGDGTLLKGRLSVDESSLNGETIENIKECNSKCYKGTIVYSGEGLLKITAVGINTIHGNIAQELLDKNEPSPLKVRLTKLAKQISKLGYIGAILVFISYLFSRIVIFNHFNLNLIISDITNLKLLITYIFNALTLSVTILVVSVPEGLPLMITLVLSSNMKRMLKKNVLVRKLTGIDAAGNLNVLLTDKTGTITKGFLEVNKIITNDSNIEKLSLVDNKLQTELYKSIYYNNSSYYSNHEVIGGNSTDRALLRFISPNYSINPKILNYEPFDSNKKYSYVTLEDEITTTYIKGAPELLINNCSTCLDKQGNIISFMGKEKINKILFESTNQGFRVIALVKSNTFHVTKTLHNLTFIGLVLIKDELRKESKLSIEIIKKAYIDTIMITGDDKITATSIAKEVGIIDSNDDIVLTSKELSTYSDKYILDNYKKIKVIARALPSDKSRLVKVLQSNDLVVGMTGDGVNDGPALKKADVGFSLGSGTEIAKEASDIVLLDDNISSICNAIHFGRTIFKSIRKFIIFQLSVNICALIISIIGPFIGINTPSTIVQMLWINMIMDTLAGIAFSYEPPLKEYMEEKPFKKNHPILNKYMKYTIIIGGLYSSLLCILFLKVPLFNKIIRQDSKYLLTAYFTLFIFIGLFNSLNARTTRINIFSNILRNKPFILITIFIAIIQMLIIYYGGNLFRSYGLNFKELIYILFLSSTIIPVDWLKKYLIKKHI